jgi:hypothetical protein
VIPWHEDYRDVVGLATWLDDHDYFPHTRAMLRFFEKPWKWKREFELWELFRSTRLIHLRSRCVESLDDNTTAEQLKEESRV